MTPDRSSYDPASDPEAWAALRRRSRRIAAVVAVVIGLLVALVLRAEHVDWPVSIVAGIGVGVGVVVIAGWLIERTMYAEGDPPR